MKTQRAITIDLEELKSFLKDQFKIDAPLYHIKIAMVEHEQTREKAVQLVWEEGSNDGHWGR